MKALRTSPFRNALRDHGIAGAWGFAEATFFFVVPDVWTSSVGLRRPKRALGTTVWALGGAMAGGAATYWWGRKVAATTSRGALVKVPAVTDVMISEVEQEIAESGAASLLRGPTRGVPYKLYARAAGLQRTSLLAFLAWSVPGRMIRFIVVTTAVSGIAAVVRRRFPGISERRITAVFWICWGAFYAVFIPLKSRRGSDSTQQSTGS
jgi:membrane protein YqaA with SNARE-associated domain